VFHPKLAIAIRQALAQNGLNCQSLSRMVIRAVAFDFGHTLVDEQKDASISLDSRPIHLMPGVSETLPHILIPMAVWANTRTATGTDLQHFLDRAGVGRFFAWVVTSVDAGFRKPAPQFFDFALRKCGLARDEVLLVGNQLNTDIAGGHEYGIRTVWLSGSAYRSGDETPSPQDIHPTYTVPTLPELPCLLESLSDTKR
jgi:phosphoglycolate phosphatase-like HAD superfamily hydrolase